MKRNFKDRVIWSLSMALVLVAVPAALMAGPMKSIHKDYSVSPAQGQLDSSEYQCAHFEADGVLGLSFRRISGGHAWFTFGCYSDKKVDATVTVKWRCSGGWTERLDRPVIMVSGEYLDVPEQSQTVGDFMEVTVSIGEFLKPGANWLVVKTALGMDTTTFQILSVSIDSDRDVFFSRESPEGNDWGADSANVRLCGKFHFAEYLAVNQKEYWEKELQGSFIFGPIHRRKAIRLYESFLDVSSTVVNTSQSEWMKQWAKDYADRARSELLSLQAEEIF